MSDSLQSPRVSVRGYTVGERLGKGTYATVYRCVSIVPGPNGIRDTVAVKCIEKKKISSSNAAIENMIQEITILKKLRHRHIVILLDFQWDVNYIYLIMEYCSGGDLSSFIRQQRSLPERVTRKFLRQLASAMRYLRSQNIAHMDLKPHNLLITSKYKPALKVADFGFAQHLKETGDFASSFRGSPLYMAPEILTRNFYDARVDLWSIGVILYECLYGNAPFACPTMEGLIKQITSGQPVVIPDNIPLSSSCRDLIEGLLRRNPNHRLTFEEFFTHPFVDLETAPSEDSLPKATELAHRALIAEESGRPVKATRLYCEAVSYFLAAIQYIDDDSEKKKVRETINRYLDRAEQLKTDLKFEVTSPSKPSNESLSEVEHLLQMWSDTPQVQAAYTVVEKAEILASEDNWDQALNKYELAVQSMLQLLNTELMGKRRDLLHKQVSKWLSRSEQLQRYMEVQKLNLSKMEENSKVEIQIEEDTERLANLNQCVIQ